MIQTVSGTSCTDTTAESGHTYAYGVINLNKAGEVLNEDWWYAPGVTEITFVAAPTVKSASISADGTLSITWSKVKGAKTYAVWYYDAAEDTLKLLGTTAKTSYTYTIPEYNPSDTWIFYISSYSPEGARVRAFSNQGA
ncbi:MAG: hypothetical protein IKQ10_05320 [Oscillospiraceae bacterium]|nr:hypothetical protein [Oscillospiraceae bacterium]